jgi:cysteinyl-tRNA synthetase
MAKIQQADAVDCQLTYEQVMDAVIKRTNARRTRQFQAADDIRNDLARQGIELFDKVNEWRSFDGSMRGIQVREREG